MENDTLEIEPAQVPTVLVMHASVGSGHKSAANAVAQAFELARGTQGIPENLQVQVLDIFDFGRIKFNGDRLASAFTGFTRPVYDLTWRYALTGRLLWGGGTAWARIMFPRLTEYIRQTKPLAVVCTHITAANATAGARIITNQDFPLVCVPTDYETEGWWPHRCADIFCVGTESMAETLRARKVEDERIRITGIPTRADFLGSYDKAQMREKFGLPQDKRVVLAQAGASMSAPYVLFREILDKILPYLHSMPNVHIAFVTGTDEEYARQLTRKCKDLGITNVSVFHYVNEMAQLMSACDASICKPGGLTVTECLCTQTPMILLGRAYGQENINVRMLTSYGAAIHATTYRELVDALRRVDSHPESIRSLLINGAMIRKPEAANDIVRYTMEFVNKEILPDPFVRKHAWARFYRGHRPAHLR